MAQFGKFENSLSTAPHTVGFAESLLKEGEGVAVTFDGYKFHTVDGQDCRIGWTVIGDDGSIDCGTEETHPAAFWALDAAIARMEADGETVYHAEWVVWAE